MLAALDERGADGKGSDRGAGEEGEADGAVVAQDLRGNSARRNSARSDPGKEWHDGIRHGRIQAKSLRKSAGLTRADKRWQK
jgi:hypothetical protein